MNNEIYPNINEQKKFTEEEINQKINESKNMDRKSLMRSKQKEIEDKIKHYIKILKRWKSVNSTFVTSGVLFTAAMAGLSAILAVPTLGLSIPIGVVIGVAAISAGSGVILPTIRLKLIGKRMKNFRSKIDKNKEILNKLYIFFEKSRDDNVITLEEYENYLDILRKHEINDLKIESKSTVNEKQMKEHFDKLFQDFVKNVNVPKN